MKNIVDSFIVLLYFVGIMAMGVILGKKSKGSSEFITGGRSLPWYVTGFSLMAMNMDSAAVLGLAGIGFAWGLYPLQWNAVHIWFTAFFASMFFVPIYWRTKIVTTPEYLEKRFNVYCRSYFSVCMIFISLITLAGGLYLGALMLEMFLGWSLMQGGLIIAIVVGIYTLFGGLKSVIQIDSFQAAFLLVTVIVVLCFSIWLSGGISNVTSIIGKQFTTLVPPADFDIHTKAYFPLPAVLGWATIAGLSWVACNFGMAQRILANRTERDAQKSLLLYGILVVLVCFASYVPGVVARSIDPTLVADKAYSFLLMEYFPVGVRGILIAGVLAALLSTADGLITSSSTLFINDIYMRFFRKKIEDNEAILATRIFGSIFLISGIILFTQVGKFGSAMGFIQEFYSLVLGVIVGLYVVGVFFKKASGNAAFVATIIGTVVSVSIKYFTQINFAYAGLMSFIYTVAISVIYSIFEKPKNDKELKNLTIYTLEDAKGPFVGLKAWPNLKKWGAVLAVSWFIFTIFWELFVV